MFHKRYNCRKWSLKNTLETPMGCRNPERYITDHLDNKFKSQIEMCEYWNIPVDVFRKRYNRRKWSLKNALETPVKTTNATDPLGNTFKTQKEMCKYWNISVANYHYYHKTQHYTKLEALHIIVPITVKSKNQTITPDLCLIEHIHENYFLCTIDNQQVVLSKEKIIQIATDYHKTLHQQKGA